jgi:uncharacterized protein (DUF1778 family)
MRNQTDERYGQIGIRISQAEREVIESAARRDQRKLSEWARLALLRAARRKPRRKAA